MADLFVEQFISTITDGVGNKLPIPGKDHQTLVVPIASAANVSTATNSMTKFVLLTADANCQFNIGDDPTATAKSRYLPADVPRFVALKGGDKSGVQDPGEGNDSEETR